VSWRGLHLSEPVRLAVKSGDPDKVEGLATRLYWSALFSEFRRDHKAEDRRNSLLNYGYALVRAAIARDLASEVFIPSLGIHHRSMQNAFNLADDFIEPWRPIVDALAFRRAAADPEGTELTRDDRKKWPRFFGPLSDDFKVDMFTSYAALLVQARGGTPSGLDPF